MCHTLSCSPAGHSGGVLLDAQLYRGSQASAAEGAAVLPVAGQSAAYDGTWPAELVAHPLKK